MSMFEIILIVAVALAAAGALWWLSNPLCDALRWLGDPQDAADARAVRPEDLHAAHKELISRP